MHFRSCILKIGHRKLAGRLVEYIYFSHNGSELGSVPSSLYTACFLRLPLSVSYARQEEKWSSRKAAVLSGGTRGR
jgi:hypothetical protein